VFLNFNAKHVPVETIACFAVGTSAYTTEATRAANGDAVVSVAVAPVAAIACVAPIGSAVGNVYVSAGLVERHDGSARCAAAHDRAGRRRGEREHRARR
jgi:hypothetical protein